MKQKDIIVGGAALVGAVAFLQEPETPPTIIDDVANVETMVAEVTGTPIQQDAKVIESQRGYDFFKIVMLETKRREALGRKGKELKPYLDGKTKAIGYGCHMKYLPDNWKKTIEDQGEKITITITPTTPITSTPTITTAITPARIISIYLFFYYHNKSIS